MSSPILSMEGVSVQRPGALILRSVDLELQPGSATALFGSNGSGKTTLLRVAASLIRPSSGRCVVLGVDTAAPSIDAVRPRIGLVGHEPALHPNLTVEENLQLVRDLYGCPAGAMDAALAAVGLDGAAGRRISRCSNGMRRRTEFARLIMTEPQLLLLDEAHVGLDPAARALVGHLVASVAGSGGAALVVSHEEGVVAPVVDRFLRIVDGAIEEEAG